MTTRSEKVRKLYALARDKGAFENEAAIALAKAQELEALTAKKIARDIAQLLEKRGMRVRVRRRKREDDWDLIYTYGFSSGARTKIPPKFDADVSYLWNRRIYIELAE